MKARRIIQVAAAIAAGALMVVASMLTIRPSYGVCPQCGFNGNLSECKYCGHTLCLSCWQKAEREQGAYICPDCGRGNP